MASMALRLSCVRLMFFSSYTASNSVWNPLMTGFMNLSASILAQLSISLDGMSS